MIHTFEKLTNKEQKIQSEFMARLKIVKRKTKKPIIIAMIGLVGSGKSFVAQKLSKLINATIVKSDNIRIELRKQNIKYGRTQLIAENIALEILNQGGNVILDSDFVDKNKRASIREKAKKIGASLIFIYTYCDIEIMIGRIITANYHNNVDDFFGGANSKWQGDDQSKGAVVKICEMWRRTPQHYDWINQNGGQWKLKKFPNKIFANIDTTDSDLCQREIEKCATKLLEQ